MNRHGETGSIRHQVYFDVTNLVACLGKPTPTGIDRIDLTYAVFLRRASSIDVTGVYVKGKCIYKVPKKAFDRILARLRRMWRSGRIGGGGQGGVSALFSNKPIGLLARSFARFSGQVMNGRIVNGHYINVSQKNLSNEAVIEMAVRGACTVLCVIHDLLPVTHPHFFDANAAANHDAKLRAVMGIGGRMVCSSETLAAELSELSVRMGFRGINLIVSGFGCMRAVFDPDVFPPLFGRPYCVMVATFEPRKNHRFLLNVWSAVIKKAGVENTPRLVLIGRRGGESQYIRDALRDDEVLACRIEVLEGVGDKQISGLIGRAEAVLIPSIVEGYGLPLYEAFAHGVPVIASDLPVFRELAGTTARLLPVGDLTTWVESILELKSSEERLMQQNLLSRWRRPTWAGHFRQLLAALE